MSFNVQFTLEIIILGLQKARLYQGLIKRGLPYYRQLKLKVLLKMITQKLELLVYWGTGEVY